MKYAIFFTVVAVSALGAIFAAPEVQQSVGWKKVNDAIRKRRPQTAIKELEPIIKSALESKNYDRAAKAIALKISMQGNVQGGKPEERITRLQAMMDELPAQIRPVMEVILAHWYWQYFQQNRWRFMQRTQTDESSGDDITSWSLPRILEEIDTHFATALKSETELQSTPVNKFDELLEKGSMPDALRPTMFDFVAYEALQFYGAGEQAGAKAQDTFVLQASSPIFAPTREFLAWNIESTDTASPTIKAIQLYQKLLAFHRDDKDQSAFADADLSRLVFGYNHAFGEEKNARYKAALQSFSEQWSNDPISARAREAWGRVLHSEGELVDARQVAQRGRNSFPNSVGGQLCYNLIQEIEAQEINVTVERVWNNPWPSIQVNYRNLTKVHFRAVRYDWEPLLGRTNYRPTRVDARLRTELLSKKPDLAWSRDLPATEDYHSANEIFPVPDDLKPGFYFLLASPDSRFGDQDNRVLVAEFWVSPMSLVLRTGRTLGTISGFVLDADTGEPLEGAQVRAWFRQRTGRQYRWTEVPAVRSDKNGMFRVSGASTRQYLILASFRGRELATGSELYAHGGRQEPKPFERTIFFTDRSLYRPGQTIRFKGICVAVDQQRDNYRTLARQNVTVLFQDANGQQISSLQFRTNDVGAFSGSFTAPRDRLTGQMAIRDPKRNGQANFSVEEYKRPKFKVELAAPDEPARLGKEVDLEGTAKAYTGAAIGGAKVAYRVVREVQYPVWWYWRCWWNPPLAQSQEIAHGATTTGDDGTFRIQFTAVPDPAVAEKDEPTFRYSVSADVTDTTGETRSDQRTVNVGYTALQASMTAGDWQIVDKKVAVSISTQSLDGEPRAAKGTVKVYELRQPDRVHRQNLLTQNDSRRRLGRRGGAEAPQPDLSTPNAWPLGPMVAEREFATDAGGTMVQEFELKEGAYRALLETQDSFGKPVTAILPIVVLDPESKRLQIKVPTHFSAPIWSVEPGQSFTALWGTGYEAGRAFVEVEHRGKIVQSYWTRRGATQATLEQGVTEAMRGGFTVRVTQVRENRAYLHSRQIGVPWSNKQLQIKWDRFVSKLKPGQEETWTAMISGPKAEKAVAEMVATLYDASLDAYRPHHWDNLQLFRSDYSPLRSVFENQPMSLRTLHGRFERDYKSVSITYRSFPSQIKAQLRVYGNFSRGRAMMLGGAPMAPGAASGEGAEVMEMDAAAEKFDVAGGRAGRMDGAAPGPGGAPALDLSKVSARKNLNETAFFFPHLVSDENGKVTMKFTMPEALTEWKLFGFVHDGDMRSGFAVNTAVTAKDLMVEPLAPRFVREGDVLLFTVKVTNQSPTHQTGTVRLTLSDARTLDSVDSQLGIEKGDQSFEVPAKQSRTYSWRLQVPDGMGFLTYKAVGSTGRLSDGEEGFLPVLSRRVLVTESLPLPIRGATTKEFEFRKLLDSAKSNTLRHQSLSVQMVSNPAWYAVMALPYLMEYPHECTEQTFNRLYANALARHIANSDPKIRRVFDQWKGTPALDSPLEKNDEIKAVMLEETPWVRQAQKESEARRNVGILFDANRLNDELSRGLRKLAEVQEEDGSWPWFPGGRPNDYITLYITTGFGRLRHLGTDIDVGPAVKSLARLDAWIDEIYREIVRRGRKDNNNLSPTIALYLYGRSFFLDDQPVAAKQLEAVNYFRNQARQFWTQLRNRQSEAHLAVALKRFGEKETPQEIMVSLKERSVTDDELGMFWRDTEYSWWWYRAPIETQAMMIEAFDEVMHDNESVEACRVWLLKQKQTQDWKTTKATADAVYGLLLRGTDLLASDALVQVTLGDTLIDPKDVEAGTGFYEQRFVRDEVKPDMGRVRATKTDAGVSWGSVHWQYLEDMSKVTPYEGTPLTLKKKLFVKENTKQGPVLRAVNGPLSVGNELVVRVEMRVDRDMEYVHLKDQRGSGVEPVDVLSRYRYRDGLGYYQSTRDTASHFFIDYLPKGTYVFEYSTRVVHRGEYQSGMAQIQCMYAPEFNSHSESFVIAVQ